MENKNEEIKDGLYIPKKKKPDGYVYPDLKPLLWGARLLMVLSIVFGFVVGNSLVAAFFCIPLTFVIFGVYCLNKERKDMSKPIDFVRQEDYYGDDIGAH